MRFVGLTGGIGSGKSTVAAMLAARGAVVIDADELAREVVEPARRASTRCVARFGREVVTPDGGARPGRARGDRVRRPDGAADLEAIVHPEVARRIAERSWPQHVDTDDVVVLDSPLLIETGTHRDCEVVVVVSRRAGDADRDGSWRAAWTRPTSARGWRRRCRSTSKAEVADVVLDNEGTLEELEAQVDRLWSDLAARGRLSPRRARGYPPRRDGSERCSSTPARPSSIRRRRSPSCSPRS